MLNFRIAGDPLGIAESLEYLAMPSREWLCGVLVLASCGLAVGQEPLIPQMSASARMYLTYVLDTMQHHALHADEINWSDLRAGALTVATGAQSTQDTYPAIFYALTQLKESHSFLRIPDSLPGVEKERAWASMRQILARRKIDPPTSVFRNRTTPNGHLIEVGGKRFAYLIVPSCPAVYSDLRRSKQGFQEYANALHAVAASLESSRPSGWIVDLRGNRGGNMYPMLAAIGFILGDGSAGYFVSRSSE